MDTIKNVKGLLIDLDGVLYVSDRPVPGAIQAMARLAKGNLAYRFITNTTTRSLPGLVKHLAGMGFEIAAENIISAPQAALRYLQHRPAPAACRLLLGEEVARDFASLPRDDENPGAIVVGDIGEQWNYSLLNQLFRQIMDGAELIALHKNRFWQTDEGLRLDIGAFIHALEYASDTQATVMGKPEPLFFQQALDDMRVSAADAVIIGDDIHSDIAGGQHAGMRGVQVRTGKFRQEYLDRSGIRPYRIIDSISDLPALLGI